MSLYNMLHGVNPLSSVFLAMIGLELSDVPRFRDTFIEQTDEGEHRIIVYTRTGGGNREGYADENDFLQSNEHYVTDYDDDYDCTYAHFVYRVPEKYVEHLNTIKKETAERKQPKQAWEDLFKAMESDEESPAKTKALEIGKQIIGSIEAIIEKGKEKE